MLQKSLTLNNRKDRQQLLEGNSVSQIPWKPFPAKSSSLTIIDNNRNLQNDDVESSNQIATTALSVLYGSEYVNGNGFYLYTPEAIDNQNSIQCENNMTVVEDDVDYEHLDNIYADNKRFNFTTIIILFWHWWKECIATLITTVFVVKKILSKPALTSKLSRSNKGGINSSPDLPLYYSEFNENKEFVSRYLSDFEPLHCLGKGGFGVVFEAKKKFDECSYAVKRISLPNNPESRDRVMREVKALAKLDHHNIVRYFNAWIEIPPLEWIDNFDKVWNRNSCSYDDLITTTMTPTTSVDSSVVIDFTKSDIRNCHSDQIQTKSVIANFCDSNDYNDSFIVFETTNGTKSENDQKKLFWTDNTNTSTDLSNRESGSQLVRVCTAKNKVFLYIQMQLCQRNNLCDWLKENVNRTKKDVKCIFHQIVSAVEYVHQKGLIHRDLKPSNIFFSVEGQVKVGDFGLVTTIDADNSTDTEIIQQENTTRNLQKHTKAVGTHLYMSPEQLNGLSYNYKVDIYSLGVILFELLVPFRTDMERHRTLIDLRSKIFPKLFCEQFPNEYDLLVLMLSDCPEKRPLTKDILNRPPLSDDCA